MFGSRLYGKVYTFSIISPNASDIAGQGRQRQRPDAPYLSVPPPDEEKRLNFRLKELLDYARRIMELPDGNDARKWRGIKGLMDRMLHDFPYLIAPDTCLELCFEDTLGGVTDEFQGPLSFDQFIDALGEKDRMDRYHDYIASHYEPIGDGDQQRPTLRAENMLLMLYSALSLEMKHHEEFNALFDDDDAAEAPADNIVRMPHFGMENSERAQQRWEAAYEWLADRKWLWRNEVDYHGWVYACCGQQKPPDGPITWHGTNAALAYIIRSQFSGQWDIAKQVFCLKEGKSFPKTFWNSNDPVPNVTKSIDRAFLAANSH